jgi:hypothetical protein
VTFAFKSTLLQSLPSLAWVAVVESGRADVHLTHGPGVIIGQDFALEGAWDGEATEVGFLNAQVILGSGIVAKDGLLKIRGSSHTLERVWVVRLAAGLVVSNSLPFALASANQTLPLSLAHVEADLLSFIDGPTGIRSEIRLSASAVLWQWVCADLSVDPSLSVLAVQRAKCPPIFDTFAEYEHWVLSTSAAVCENAKAVGRPATYAPLATVSRGYDSPACAVIARHCGATEAITFSEARTGYATSTDDGTEIATVLGLQTHRYARETYLGGTGMPEMACLASGGGGEDVVLAAAQEKLAGSVLFTGFLGDTLWGLHGDPSASRALRIRYPGGGSLGEYRLRVGFVHLPIPILLLASHESVLAISHSPEMAPWRLGTEYDRPIPRRIAESAGIPRDAFGSNKMAITAPMYYDRAPAEVLGAAALQRWEQFTANNRQAIATSRTTYDSGRRLRQPWALLRERIEWRVSKMRNPPAILASLESRLSDRWRRPASDSLFLVHWAVSELISEYRDVLAAAGLRGVGR